MATAKLVIEPKKWLGDNKILKMDWDVRGMHFHLMLLAWQNFPQGTLEADEKLVAKLLSIDPKSSDWLERIKPQLLTVWAKKSLPNEQGVDVEYYVQAGLVKEVEKQTKPKKASTRSSKTKIDARDDKENLHLELNSGFNLLDIFKEELTPEEKEEAKRQEELEAQKRQQDNLTIWKLGADLLVSDSFSEARARAFLGKLAKEYGAHNLASAIGQITLKKTNPVEAKSYLVSILKNIQKPPAGHFKTPHNQASGRLIL